MRDPGVIDELDALERYARAFDAISDEQDAHYSAQLRAMGAAGDAGAGGCRAAPSEVGRAVEAAYDCGPGGERRRSDSA
jgi:hypothetical protein